MEQGVDLTDIFAAIVRYLALGAVLFVFIVMVFSFSAIVNVTESDKVLVEVSEGMFSAKFEVDARPLTVSRAVFDYQALEAMNKKVFIEPVRNCKLGAFYEFFDLDANEKISSFGYKPSPSEQKSEKDFYIALAKENIDKSLTVIPGKMHITVTDDYVTKRTCAIEEAWIFNKITEADVTKFPSFIRLPDQAEHSIFLERWIPTEIKIIDSFEVSGDDRAKAFQNNKIIVWKFIPMKVSEFESKGCSDWSIKENGAAEPDPKEERIICIKTEIR